MQRRTFGLVLELIFLAAMAEAQERPAALTSFDPEPRGNNGIRVVFYNTENLFDWQHDTLTNDLDFLPEGRYGWTPGKFFSKLNSVAKVLLSAGGWDPPEIIGLSEIENQSVVSYLATRNPLAPFSYRSIHFDSPDARGVDVALLFRPDRFELLYAFPLKVALSGDTAFKTRDILYVQGRVLDRDTLHLFVNHWPSKLGGERRSRPHQMAAVACLTHAIDSVLQEHPAAKIVVMGDLNDVPTSEVVQSLVNRGVQLVNLMDVLLQKKEIGSYKFAGKWSLIDQILVSRSLLNANGLHVKKGACIFAASFLLVPDERYGGTKPFRSFQGPRYLGGFSDHLPVYVDLVYPGNGATQ